ncbi:HK97 gp10 family phage protein [Virgibacillus siamensis]|uniref:HK97 gp10 family phage protein n=1 Tax=Virgibacillus siamensis TaxID=480071 RepID=UPI003631FFE5
MTDFEIDTRNLDVLKREIDDLQKLYPKQAKQMMARSGAKARTIVSRKARQLVKKKTGNYFKSIKRGKVWKDDDGVKVRVYSRAPHAHLLEYGHRIVDKAGNEHGFQEGFHVFDKASHEIESEWDDILEKEFERMLSKL